MPRRFTRAVRVAEIAGAIAAVVVLAILFVPGLFPAAGTLPHPASSSRT